MILRRLRVHPFGCFPDREISFTPGLNVVLGPNEAGKSTLFRAIRNVLFVRSRLQKKSVGEQVTPYLPVTGGDCLRAELAFDADGGRYVLRRRWGSAPASELVLPGGGSLADDDAILERTARLLPAKPGTTANILMTEQAALAGTLAVLNGKAHESLSDLADILRQAVLSTGGVSVDRFLERLAQDAAGAWSRWDKATGGPEAGRGVEKRWKKEVGLVLQAWYGREDARAARKEAQEWEAVMDSVNARLRAAASARSEREGFVRSHAAAARDARERRGIEGELRAARAEADAALKVSAEWPGALLRARELAEAEAKAVPALAALEAEREAARKAEQARELREKYERVMRRKAQVDEASAALAASPRLEKKDLDGIRAAVSTVARAEAGAAAGMISVTIAGRAEAEVAVQEDFSPEDRRKLAPGKQVRLRGADRIRIIHHDMEIEVRSGDADAGARAEKVAAARAALAGLLAKHGVADPEAAEERSRAWEALAADRRAAEKNLAEDLDRETLSALQQRVAALGPAAETRPLAAVAAAHAAARVQAEARTREIADVRLRLAEWETKHGSMEKLLTALAVLKGREKELSARLEHAAPLPPGYSEAGVFLEAWDRAQMESVRLAEELRGLEERKMSLQQDAPELTPEELTVQVREADQGFDGALHRAQALDRLLARSGALLGAGETGVFSGMTARLSETLAAMTRGRHAGVVMDGAVPIGIMDAPGTRVSWEQLSAGTKDTLALALRIAMASYFLGDADGFMLLDDPLVDMDPERQRAAAAALREFAAKRQLILFTCHPATADLLGGSLHRLAGPD